MRWISLCSRAVLVVALAGGGTCLSRAQTPSDSAPSPPSARIARATRPAPLRTGPHGGTLRVVEQIQTETVVRPGGIKVYLFSHSGQPIDPADGRGVATLRVSGNGKRYRYDLFPGGDGSLSIPVNLSKLAGRQITVDYQLVGIEAAGKAVAAYRDVATVPANPAQQRAAAIARQKVCPVSGEPLGSMGKPVAVDAGSQTVYVCCAGCVGKVEANPAKYASTRPEVKVVETKKSDAPLIAKQSKCPVMNGPLRAMGGPVKLLVGDQPLFLCCRGCIKKVKAKPEKYLAVVAEDDAGNHSRRQASGGEQVRPGVFRVTDADKRFVAAQKICPVMDEPLDAMGGPYRVEAEGKAIYICCPGCAKRIAKEPQKYLAKLSARGVQPPSIRR